MECLLDCTINSCNLFFYTLKLAIHSLAYED